VPHMNGWQNMVNGTCDAATGYQCITGAQPSAVPNITSLAQNFAISDALFSMADSPSWGGHLYAVTGSLDGFTGDNPKAASGVTPRSGWGCDSNKVTPWISPSGAEHLEPSCIPDPSLPRANGGAFEPTPVPQIPTILDRLDAAGLSWRIYGAPRPSGHGYVWSMCPTIAECLYTSQKSNLVPAENFVTDAANGNLPAFTVVTPGGTDFPNSCHPGFSLTACDNWVGSLVSSIEKGSAWASTAVFITWDDCGCYYDQVPPPGSLNADGQQAGPRVPLIIVSPYAKPGYTDTTPTTFAGILAYTEHTFGLHSLGPNDANAYDLSNAFNYSQAPLKPIRMITRPLPAWARHLKLTKAMLNDPS
jgi:phospholipase C